MCYTYTVELCFLNERRNRHYGKSADKMGQKHNTHFSVYKCLYCDGYHIGKNRENKTDYDKKVITDVEVKDKTLILK